MLLDDTIQPIIQNSCEHEIVLLLLAIDAVHVSGKLTRTILFSKLLRRSVRLESSIRTVMTDLHDRSILTRWLVPNPSGHIANVRYRGGNENKAYGCSSSLHARDYNFQGAATRLVENVHLIDKEELYLVEDLIVLLPVRDISNQRQSFSYQAERTNYG